MVELKVRLTFKENFVLAKIVHQFTRVFPPHASTFTCGCFVKKCYFGLFLWTEFLCCKSDFFLSLSVFFPPPRGGGSEDVGGYVWDFESDV